MANLLCIESATTNCSVALSINGSVIAFREDTSKGYSHAELLHVFIDQVLELAQMKVANLDAIAVSKGPGSYTGLRIGVSAAKGLCYALDLPLLSIPTLESLAHKVNSEGCIVPMLDARRMEVYGAIFTSDKQILRETKAEILTPDSFAEYLDQGTVTFIGSGVDKFEAICKHPNAVFIKEEFPSAVQMALLASKKYKIGDTEDVAYFEPYYLKDFLPGRAG